MTESQMGSIGERDAGREARALGSAAKRAVESYLTLSLMIIDSSITEGVGGVREGPWLANSHHLTKSHGTVFGLAFGTQTHRIHTNSVSLYGCTQIIFLLVFIAT